MEKLYELVDEVLEVFGQDENINNLNLLLLKKIQVASDNQKNIVENVLNESEESIIQGMFDWLGL